MPKFNKRTDEETIKAKQKTNTGLIISAGEITHSDWDSKDWRELQQDYVNMMNGCPVISTTWKSIEYPLMQAKLNFDPGKSKSDLSKQACDYLYWGFDSIQKKERYLRKHILKAIYNGVSFHEMIEKKADKYEFFQNNIKTSKLTNRIVKLSPIQNDTISKFYYDEQNNFSGLEHERRRIVDTNNVSSTDTDLINIDSKDLHYFTFDEEFDDIRGKSILRPVRYYFDIGQKIMTAKAVGVQRGSGIIGIHTKGKVTDAEKTKFEKLGRTIASMSNGYYMIDQERADVVLQELRGQQDSMELIQFINRMKFYNTMSQFLTSGIGESGSRAATEQHKAPYELALNYTNSEIQSNYQEIANRMIDMSFFAPMAMEDYPIVRFSSITQSDMLREAQVFKTFVEAGLQLTNVDMNMIREHLNLPVAEINIDTKQTTSVMEEPTAEKTEFKKLKHENRKIAPEIMEFESRVFEMQSAIEHFENTQGEVETLLSKIQTDILKDLASQLEKDKNREPKIKLSYEIVLKESLEKIYFNAFSRGETDVKKEIKKIGGAKTVELQLSSTEEKTLNKNIDRVVKKFFSNIIVSVENSLSRLSEDHIKKVGGIESHLLKFSTGFKAERRDIINEIEAGYTDGRGAELKKNADKIETYLYTAILDKNLCANCTPFDGLVFTMQELNENGLNVDNAPHNPNCVGVEHGNMCRCQLIPFSLKD